jgi:hypothetical protein
MERKNGKNSEAQNQTGHKLPGNYSLVESAPLYTH